MKLAFYLFNYFPYGGLQRDFIRIAKECVRKGHRVDVFTMRWQGERDPDLNVTIVPVSGWQNHTKAQYFASHLANHKSTYDLIVGFNKMPGLDVYYAADTCYQAKTRKKHGLLYRLTPRFRHLVNYEKAVFDANSKTEILLISPLQQPEFIQYYQTPATRFHQLPPGISRDRIAPENAPEIRTHMRTQLGLTTDEFILLMVGSGFKTKGLDRTLTGLASLPPELKNRCRLLIVGEDNAEPFKQQAEKMHIADRVTFLGGRNDVAQLLLVADLLLHPAYNENTGTVLLEALVAGLPVLTTNVCGYAHFVEEAQAGIVLPSPFQQNQFNKTLQTMLVSDEHKHWQMNGLRFAKQADIYSMPERAAILIENLASARHP